MHEILVQVTRIIDSFVVPICQLSEEAQEARIKDFKRCRENNSRKTSPVYMNEDILHLLLFSADRSCKV